MQFDKDSMKTISCFVALCLFSTACYANTEKTPVSFTTPEGTLSFGLPPEWEQIPAEQITAFNFGRPEQHHFNGGIADNSTSTPKAYMLLQVKKRPPESKDAIERYRAAATEASELAVVTQAILTGSYRKKAEFYSPKHDAFILLNGTAAEMSVMVKRFTSYGYFLMHFYLDDQIERRVGEIDSVLQSIREEQSR